MQHITEQHRIESLVLHWKVSAVVRQIIDPRRSVACDIETDHGRAEHALQVMRDEAVATADVEYVGPRRQHAGHFKRHIVCSPDFAPPSHALEATLDGCA